MIAEMLWGLLEVMIDGKKSACFGYENLLAVSGKVAIIKKLFRTQVLP